MTEPIGVGVIGCGKIAQMMHLPFLHELPEFRVAAICDISPELLATVGKRHGVAAHYLDHRELLADPDVEAVVICNYDHGPVLADVIAAGKHVIVEKPLAFTAEEAAPLVAAAEAAGIVAMIGYMKFHDPGYRMAQAQLAAMDAVGSVTVHDTAGRMDIYNPLYTLTRGEDVSPEALAAGQAAVDARVDAMLGHRAGHRAQYLNLLMLGSHDLAALRGLIGRPRGVAYARAVTPTHVFAVLDYPAIPQVTLEVGFGARTTWWEEWIHIRAPEADLRLEFAHPYARHAPATLRRRQSREGCVAEERQSFTPADSFRSQWRHFARCIREGEQVLTPLADGLADLELARDIIRALPPTGDRT